MTSVNKQFKLASRPVGAATRANSATRSGSVSESVWALDVAEVDRLLTFSPASINVSLHKPPINQWVVYKGLEHSHQRLLVVAKDLHGDLASVTITSLDSADLVPLAAQRRQDMYPQR